MAPKGTKKSLQEMLAEHGSKKRNDWNNGRPGGAATRIGADGFPEYDPSAFESDGEEEGNFGGAFAALAGLGGLDDDEDEFVEVVSKKSKKKPMPAAGPGPSAGAGPSSSRAPAPLVRGANAGAGPSSSRAAALPVPRPSAALVMPRAPYGVGAAEAAPPPRAPRPRTHDDEGRPISDNYYQTFQKVYRNTAGDVCMRFHKTDIVVAKPSGEVVVTSGGYKTKTTFQSVSEGLAPMGITLCSSRGEGFGEWWVELADGTRQDWQDNMTIPANSAEDRGRGQRLYAAYHGASAAPSASGRVAAAGPAGAPHRPGAAAAPQAQGSYRPVGAAAAGAAAAPAGSASRAGYGAGAYGSSAPRPGVPGAGAAGSVAAVTRDPSVAAAAGSGGGDAESLHALISSALLLQDEALIAGSSQAHAEHLLDDEHCCIACMEALRTTVIIPCGHMVLCADCAADVVARTGVCPMCREKVETTVTVQ